MCLIIFAHRVDDATPLVVAANRDEFHARPTRPSQLWPEHPDLLAGQDLDQGGTWMGVTRHGRFAAITNFRGGAGPAPRSRGELTLDFLLSRQGPEAYLDAIMARADEYAGFNLLVGDDTGLWYYGNHAQNAPRALAPGVYGLSNAALDTPWPKVADGKTRLMALLQTRALAHEDLASVVSDPAEADPAILAGLGQHSAMEQRLSSQFIVTPEYGTRSTTTLRRDANGDTHWQEISFDSSGAQTGQSELVLTSG